MSKQVALIRFTRGSFDQEYSYFTDIEDLKEGDILVVPTSNSYSIGVFSRYSKSKIHIDKAEKWIVKNINSDIKVFEEKMFLEDLKNG
ncbi:hypothetical protein C1H57_12615 [Clostridium sp. 2-1]|uniref:hypothetical protein n=1 Tax=Clostridium TaxID=1485 RepID=UPI000CDA7D50|nr:MULTISPECIES: hypothetical protein [Clostridium]MBN7575990.1 hypothetical protein [Clostridium beijerinckii]MBN7581177.1 hypothetical protein [Clostridium beijerinckii]MBN7585711.1 hypothetical protein [Clostridium beijerinckii]MBO0521500.1 hypothetical protein [Clostridium beijerinckii]POO91022.1 hypothetical protein C1H57_12615 [Clostridium sp. 2-1]